MVLPIKLATFTYVGSAINNASNHLEGGLCMGLIVGRRCGVVGTFQNRETGCNAVGCTVYNIKWWLFFGKKKKSKERKEKGIEMFGNEPPAMVRVVCLGTVRVYAARAVQYCCFDRPRDGSKQCRIHCRFLFVNLNVRKASCNVIGTPLVTMATTIPG